MRVAIVGTGLIGGSIGLALRAADPSTEVVAFDRDPGVAARAIERGAATRVERSPGDAASGADIVFVCTPVSAIAPTVGSLAEALKPGSILTDVGSTKSRVVLEVEGSLPDGVHFIGGHPMSGSEEDGIAAASGDLFRGAWWVLTPTETSDATAYQRLHTLITTLGARVMAVPPSAHDDLVATVSHVPQLMATALMTMAAGRGEEHAGFLALAAGGFRDVTRIAASNPEMWLDICEQNGTAIAGALDAFSGRLQELRDLLERGDRDQLRAVFEAARRARRSLPGKHVAGDLYDVRMPVPDRPGVLAEVTTSVGNVGVNIEDLQLSHAAEGGRGTLTLAIIGQAEAERVAAVLRELGYEPHVHLQ